MQYIKIGDLCNVSSSKRVFARQYVDNGIPFYRQKEVIDKKNGNTIEEPIYISESDYNIFKAKFGVPANGDLLITAVGATLGIPYFVGNEQFYFKDGNLIWLSNFKEKLNSKFLYYWIDSSFGTQTLWNRTIGSAQPALTIDSIKKLSIPVPSKAVQDKISTTLTTFDQIIENNNKRIKLLAQMAENLYKEWFVRFRFPGYEDVEFEEKKPRGWQVVTEDKKHFTATIFKYDEFKNIGSFLRGKNITAAKMVEGDIPVISAGLQPSGYHNEANVFGESLTISASGANAGYLQYHLQDIWAADCSYYQDDAIIWFVYNTLKFLQPVIINLQCGAAQPHVYPKNINKLCVLIPTEELIYKYNDFVKPYYDEIKILNKRNQSLTKQRDMLLPRLMSGKLEV
ncbi:restriction endonuclease subunit S [Streptococcus oralis]|uniref:restriction endonuclease subunit S n=1 Tax=Streptococcus oralis TaxID=1303 RepID=UPI0023304F68|nr:restriction endonuclease subunit S [Streptococcus oralis]MDB6209637.1 restriction endonuclease subunit S [Streptococcus oralis]